MQINKIRTNNPIMDNLVYYIKQLGLYSISKDEEVAFQYETLYSIRNAELYLLCVEGKATFVSFEKYDKSQLERGGVPFEMLEKCMVDKFKIPDRYRPLVLKAAIEDTLEGYIETNKYYLNVNGEPGPDDEILYVDYEIAEVDTEKPIHLMNNIEIQILDKTGVLDDFRRDYPSCMYLNFLGDKKVPYHESRRAPKFGLIYTPPNIPNDIVSKFKTKYERSRVYVLKCVYSEAFKLESVYYDSFIQMFIKLQTMCDIIVELPDFIIRRELFDVQSVKYMFESNGVKFFDDIPLKYQMRMLKNLNKLIKFKSSDKNIVDICSIFGFENIGIFKYYILRNHRMDSNGNYVFEYLDDEDKSENVDVMYDLKFVRVPIEDKLDNYIREVGNWVSYEEMTSDDPYWNCDTPPELIKRALLQKEFNSMRSKYISIDTVYDVTKLSFEMAYFFNMIFDDQILENGLTTYCSTLSPAKQFKISDLIVLLYVLMYESNGIEDTIQDTQSKVLHVMGFNFKADLMELQNYVISAGYRWEDFGFSEFMIPDTPYLSYKQLMEVYTTNKKIYEHLRHQMNNATDIREYRIYEKLFDSLMVSEFNQEIFKLPNGELAPTYTEWLYYRDAIIYSDIQRIRALETDEKSIAIQDIMSAVVISLEDYIEDDPFEYLFDNIPMLTADMIRKYIYEVVDFFKSYKIELKSINTIYRFDDYFTNKIIRLDALNVDLVTFGGIEDKNVQLKDNLYSMIATFLHDDIFIPEDWLEELTSLIGAKEEQIKDNMNVDLAYFTINDFDVSQQYSHKNDTTDVFLYIKDSINVGENVDWESTK